MAAVRSLQVKSDSGSDRSEPNSDSESDRDAREAEPMEVEEGELEAEDISVNRSLKELLPVSFRLGLDRPGTRFVCQEAFERKEKRARRFHFRCEESVGQRNVFLDKDAMKKAIFKLRMEAIHVSGVDDMSTQDVFGYFREYPPAHIEWINDTSCNVVWLDDDTCIRALINSSQMPTPEVVVTETESSEQPGKRNKTRRVRGSEEEDDDDDDEEEEEEGEVEEEVKKNGDEEVDQNRKVDGGQVDDLSAAERESLLRNELRPAIKPFKGNKLFLRFATQDDKKELGAARRSRYYMKYGNPNYGGMKGILSNSWKRRYHNRRIQRDVIKSKKPLIGDSMGHTPPYTHRHSADLVNLPEEPIKEEEEEEEEEQEDQDEDMDSDDRVVEYKERGGDSRTVGAGLCSRAERSPSPWSESDEMDYDLELKMISTPSPKKTKKMTMYADELETQLKTIRSETLTCLTFFFYLSHFSWNQDSVNLGSNPSPSEQSFLVSRQGCVSAPRAPPCDVRQRLGKRRYSPDERSSPSPLSPKDTPPVREPVSDVHRRLGVANQDSRSVYSKPVRDRKTSTFSSEVSSPEFTCRRRRGEGEREVEEEDDSKLQRMWGAMIKQKQDRLTHKMKKSRLDHLPSLQIEISRDSTDDSDV
uniref:Nuclear cap-binding protein subunit 3 n=1 Tax=Nothobranchius furzeri TaxID=105023 RepID=A0A8C6NY68_NOTFU